LAGHYQATAAFYKVDSDANSEILEAVAVTSLPTFHIYNKGSLVLELVAPTDAELQSAVDAILGAGGSAPVAVVAKTAVSTSMKKAAAPSSSTDKRKAKVNNKSKAPASARASIILTEVEVEPATIPLRLTPGGVAITGAAAIKAAAATGTGPFLLFCGVRLSHLLQC
jgi:hypothetical protein